MKFKNNKYISRRILIAIASFAVCIFGTWYFFTVKEINSYHHEIDHDLALSAISKHFHDDNAASQTFGWNNITPFNFSAIRPEIDALTKNYKSALLENANLISCASLWLERKERHALCDEYKFPEEGEFNINLSGDVSAQALNIIADRYFKSSCSLNIYKDNTIGIVPCEQNKTIIHWNYIAKVGLPRLSESGEKRVTYFVKGRSKASTDVIISPAILLADGKGFASNAIEMSDIVAWAAFDNDQQ